MKTRNNTYKLEIYQNKRYKPVFTSHRPSQVYMRLMMRKGKMRVKMNDEVVSKISR